ncbi:histidine phosphatase family protein [Chelatococcus sambhunathii]|uniref:Histidine phosphatase family protein n=1 Tax=Chelatococcus sambhunathii TaxID=363953 RepID=A0ABU1DCG4_9HYPH|nr:histidine phosphatase family protein [Chelatococcus sambhunathii]MDR4305804.1 histidine phosphatase family protein [Chelatococcus sambhunathii]
MIRLAAALLCLFSAPAFADDAALWRALAAGGHAAIMRHATAPGVGDPAGFKLGDCATQRNLSEEGRAEARALGDRFRKEGVAVGRVATSQWCRCRDTAVEMALGEVVEDPRLNSFFGSDREATRKAVDGVKAALAETPRAGPIAVLVTHQVNVTATTGVYPASGEIVVVRLNESGAAEVVGTLKP